MGSHTRPAHFPVLADEPVEIHRPRRTIRLIVAFFAAAILLTGGAAYLGTTYAVDRADSHLRHSRDQLATELAERRRQRDAEHAEVSRDLCTLVTRLPADPGTDALRRRYGCGPFTGTGQPPTAVPGAGTGAEPGAESPAARVQLPPPRAGGRTGGRPGARSPPPPGTAPPPRVRPPPGVRPTGAGAPGGPSPGATPPPPPPPGPVPRPEVLVSPPGPHRRSPHRRGPH